MQKKIKGARPLQWLTLIVFIFVFSIIGIHFFSAERSVVIQHDLQNENIVQEIKNAILSYTATSNTSVSLTPLTTNGESADIHILQSFPETTDKYTGALVPWSGRLWTLAIHRSSLDLLDVKVPELALRLREGTLDTDSLDTVLATLATNNIHPITLGNSHGWPFLLWLQFVTAAQHGPAAAREFPHTEAIPQSVMDAHSRLAFWRDNNWFNPETWNRGWAAGLEPLIDGTAAFAILNDTLLSALPPQHRSSMIFVPFPGGTGSDAWTVGSAHYLALLQGSRRQQSAARSILEHLTSPEVTARLSRATGRPFFAWQSQDDPAMVLDAWIDRANTPELQALARWAVN